MCSFIFLMNSLVFLGGLVVFVCPVQRLRLIGLWVFVLLFVFSLLAVPFLCSSEGNSFKFSLPVSSFESLLGIDGVSLLLIQLSMFLFPACVLLSWESVRYRFREFLIALLVVAFCLVNVFATTNLLSFYIFFEASMVPIFLIIGVWGSRLRRVVAAYRFFFYTLLASVAMLISLLYVYIRVGSFDLNVLCSVKFSLPEQLVLWFAFFCVFAVKVPMVPVHIWLPEAHVEAPTAGSVLLAGILLKLGGYGFFRFSLPLFPEASAYVSPFVFILSIFAVLYISLVTLVQVDLKKMIAYSSVSHMGYVTIGLFTGTLEGINGGILAMFSHGLISSALFVCVGCLYDRYGTRLLRYYSGIAYIMPIFATFFFILCLANSGFPGTIGFVSEFLIILGVFKINSLVGFLLGVGSVLSSAYTLWLYGRICFGSISPSIVSYSDLNLREVFVLLLFVVPILLFGLYPFPLLALIGLVILHYFAYF